MNTSDVPIHPRITRAYAESLIKAEKIFADPEMSVVICVARLKNRHRVVGTAIVANQKLYDYDTGVAIARGKVIDQIIKDEMYVLRTKLSELTEDVTNAD